VTDGQTDGRTDRQTERQTDGIAMAYTCYSIYAVARKKLQERAGLGEKGRKEKWRGKNGRQA